MTSAWQRHVRTQYGQFFKEASCLKADVPHTATESSYFTRSCIHHADSAMTGLEMQQGRCLLPSSCIPCIASFETPKEQPSNGCTMLFELTQGSYLKATAVVWQKDCSGSMERALQLTWQLRMLATSSAWPKRPGWISSSCTLSGRHCSLVLLQQSLVFCWTSDSIICPFL